MQRIAATWETEKSHLQAQVHNLKIEAKTLKDQLAAQTQTAEALVQKLQTEMEHLRGVASHEQRLRIAAEGAKWEATAKLRGRRPLC